MNNQLIVFALKDLFAEVEKNKIAATAVFPIFIINFLSHSYSGFVIATVFKLSGEVRY